jgi:hypothetical protein
MRKNPRARIIVSGYLFVAIVPLMAQAVDIRIPGEGLITTASGINNAGFIVGYFGQASAGWRSFITTPSGQPLHILDMPYRAMRYKQRAGSPPAASTSYAFAFGINDHGVVAGGFGPYGVAASTGFLRRPSGAFDIVNVPGSTFTKVLGINDLGELAGVYEGADGTNGFIRDKSGRFVKIAYPGAAYTQVNGSNVRGEAVGEYVDSEGGHAFMYDLGSSEFTDLPIRGGDHSAANGINDEGDIVGSVVVGSQTFGFIRTSTGGYYVLAVPPPAGAPYDTVAFGINNFGAIVGTHNSVGFYCRWRPGETVKDACPSNLIP